MKNRGLRFGFISDCNAAVGPSAELFQKFIPHSATLAMGLFPLRKTAIPPPSRQNLRTFLDKLFLDFHNVFNRRPKALLFEALQRVIRFFGGGGVFSAAERLGGKKAKWGSKSGEIAERWLRGREKTLHPDCI